MNHEKDIIEEIPAFVEQNITPKDLLGLAKYILMAIAIMFCLGCISELYQKGSAIFEACKTILPPIATLVIGFYFGKSS